MPSDTLAATGWMVALAVLLGWIPVVGPLAAGFVGGRRAGSPGAALLAAILPALVAGVLVWLLVYALPEIGGVLATVFAAAVALWVVVQMGLVVLGALVGGFFGRGRAPRGRAAV